MNAISTVDMQGCALGRSRAYKINEVAVNPEICASFISESDSTQENGDHPSISSVETNGDTVLCNSGFVTLHSFETSFLTQNRSRKDYIFAI